MYIFGHEPTFLDEDDASSSRIGSDAAAAFRSSAFCGFSSFLSIARQILYKSSIHGRRPRERIARSGEEQRACAGLRQTDRPRDRCTEGSRQAGADGKGDGAEQREIVGDAPGDGVAVHIEGQRGRADPGGRDRDGAPGRAAKNGVVTVDPSGAGPVARRGIPVAARLIPRGGRGRGPDRHRHGHKDNGHRHPNQSRSQKTNDTTHQQGEERCGEQVRFQSPE